MSEDVLKIVPRDPAFLPAPATYAAAVAELRRLCPDGEMFETEIHDQISLIDNGENLEAILCPACGARNEIDYFDDSDDGDPILAWWQAHAEELGSITAGQTTPPMPCCAAQVPVLDLRFHWPAAFARFELSVWNPDRGDNLDAEELAKLEGILGCPLIQVRAHY